MAFLIAARLLTLLPLLRAEQAPGVDIEQDDLAMMQSSHPPKKHHIAKAWAKKIRNAQLKAFDDELGIDPPPMPNSGEADAIGLLVLTYGYPTQPGDIDDKRSFCTVDENYTCIDGFSVVKAEVHGLTFMTAQENIYNSTLEESFTNALRALLSHPRVRAITANCGFITNYATKVKDLAEQLVKKEGLTPKPIVLGSLALGPLLTHQTGQYHTKGWGILDEDQRAVVVTANSNNLDKNFNELMKNQGLRDFKLQDIFGKHASPAMIQKLKLFLHRKYGLEMDDDSGMVDHVIDFVKTLSMWAGLPGGINFLMNSGKNFRTYGAQDVQGFGGALKDGTAHNASLAGPYMNQWVLDTLFRIEYDRKKAGAVKGAFFIFECTELPVYSNGVRMATRKPVWDITTLAQCLMAAAPTYDPSAHIFENAAFKACLMSWTNPYRFEERFGMRPNLMLVGYEGGKNPHRTLKDFDWGVLGKPKGARCTKEVQCAE